MLVENLAAFVIAAFALTGSPGPATLGLSAAAAAFDRATKPRVAQIVAGHREAFADWTDAEFAELFSRFGHGGELTETGALAAAEAMNDRRELLAQVALILETHEAEHLREFVAMLHKRITDVA